MFNENEKEAFGKSVREVRTEKKLTTAQLARMCDIQPVSLRQIESGTRFPSFPLFLKLCDELRTPPQVILKRNLPVMELDNYFDDTDFKPLMERIMTLSDKEVKMLIKIIDAIHDSE